jgi:F-type H+-transporting ATPase subunit epsilon
MSNHLQFELASPEKMLIDRAVAMVTVPGSDGAYGVLIGHAPMITTLSPGVVEVYDQNDSAVSERIFVTGGFAEVTGQRCTILAEKAMPVSALNRAAVESEVKTLGDEIVKAETDETRGPLESRMEIAAAKLRALS